MPRPKKKFTHFKMPKSEDKRIEIMVFLNGFKLLKDAVGDGSWAEALKIAVPEWARKALKGTQANQERTARMMAARIAFDRVVELGAKPVFKTAKKKGKQNVKAKGKR